MTAPDVKALTCPACGAAITLRTGAQALTVVCDSCHAVLDAKDSNLSILQKFGVKLHWTPAIPLGTKGDLKGEKFMAIGFQVRSITADGEKYSWREYTLWNPYQGYRYLSEYDGHWNDIVVAKSPPTPVPGSDPPVVEFHGEVFKHFQTAEATTDFILGEFPWQVKVGDKVQTNDYVSPPHMLSSEVTKEETTWSIGTYSSPQFIWNAFSLPGEPPSPQGVFENQPDDYGPRASALAKVFALFAALLIVFFIARQVTALRAPIFHQSYAFKSPTSDTSAFVTPVFPITGHTSNVEVTISANVANSWAYFNVSLINDQTGKAIDFGREVGYYYGSDSDGPWSEGSTEDVSYVPAVPPGNYFLRVQPEGPVSFSTTNYSIALRRDVPRLAWFLIAFVLLAAVPMFMQFREMMFESMRWKESDHPMGKTSSGTDDGDSSDDS